jgi:hypothetical protein
MAPARLTPEADGWSYGANPAFLLLALAGPFLLRRRFAATSLVPAVLFFAIILLLGTKINLRYLIPAIPLLTIATAAVLAEGQSRRFRVVALGVIALALLASGNGIAVKLGRTKALAHAAGVTARQDYLDGNADPEILSYVAGKRILNENVSEGARVLMLFEARGYEVKPQVLQDNITTNWPLLVPAIGESRCLESTGVTHVLLGTRAVEYLIGRGMDVNATHWDRFPAFAERCLEEIFEGEGYRLFRVIEAKLD